MSRNGVGLRHAVDDHADRAIELDDVQAVRVAWRRSDRDRRTENVPDLRELRGVRRSRDGERGERCERCAADHAAVVPATRAFARAPLRPSSSSPAYSSLIAAKISSATACCCSRSGDATRS